MKKVLFTIASVFMLALNVVAQAPEKMSYQSVIRDADDDLIETATVGVQISILQGAIDGTTVYAETHAPTTNINGLISLEIGTGTVVSGDFSAINWGDGPFYIKSETDPEGGMDYTITGTSQLMSVPYAFHANIADSIVGGITVTEMDTALWNNHTDSTDIATMGFITESIGRTYEVGDFAQGGVVVWVDETAQHGIVCAKEDFETVRWFAGTYGRTRCGGNGPLAGEMNTSIIISSQVAIGDDGGDYAAALCNELVVTEDDISYSDWYLPSSEEMGIMGANRLLIDATAIANGGTAIQFSPYWTSNESVDAPTTDARAKLINPDGVSDMNTNKAATFNVRAFRRF
mgnify:CR=1 FL=1